MEHVEDRLVELSGVEMTYGLPEPEPGSDAPVDVQIAGSAQAPLSALQSDEVLAAGPGRSAEQARASDRTVDAETPARPPRPPADEQRSTYPSDEAGSFAAGPITVASGAPVDRAAPTRDTKAVTAPPPRPAPATTVPVSDMFSLGMVSPANEPGVVWGSADTYGLTGFTEVSVVHVAVSYGSCRFNGDPTMVAQPTRVVGSDFRQWMAVSRDVALEASCPGVGFTASWTAWGSSVGVQHFTASWTAGE
jgi:hypothetical protein